ncbi:MAG TPA: hypothetical protein VF403_15115 [Kofleriaceae bacterium]
MRALLLLLVACAHPVAPVAGAPEVIVAHAHPRAFALADGVVIWSTVHEHTSSIIVTPRHGGASRTLVEGIPVVRTLVVHDTFVYFATEDRIGRIPVMGGVPEMLVEGPATDLAVTDTALIWIDSDLGLATTPQTGGEPRVLIASHILRGLLVAGNHAYVGGNPQILRVPLGPGVAAPFGGDVEVCTDAMLEHAGALYAATCHDLLERIPLDGSEAKVVAPDIGFVTSIAESGDGLVLAFGAEKQLALVPFAGGELRRIPVPTGAERIAIDPHEPNVVYILDEGITSDSGHIVRLTL